MEYIHPKQRYSKSATRSTNGLEQLKSVLEAFGLSSDSEVSVLSGGFMNANYKVTTNSHDFVLRAYATNEETAKREHGLLNFMNSNGIRVPKSIAIKIIDEKPYALHEFIEGQTLEDYLLAGGETNEKLYEDIGRQLAKIHQIKFEEDGVLDEKVEISQSWGCVDDHINSFMLSTMEKISDERLSAEMKERTRKIIESECPKFKEAKRNNTLTHFDFNPKNMMVNSSGELTAILDWEFTMAANSLADLGNFFRFPYDYPDFAKDSFEKGYRYEDPTLPENWFELGLLIDLGAMFGFLERKEDYQESFHTARTVIGRTLGHFGY